MTEMVLPVQGNRRPGEQQNLERLQVVVHIQAEVIDPDIARRRANIWLTMNAGHLLMADHPELVLREPLQWRFDVILSIPQHDRPGSVTQNRIGQIRLDALTGEVAESTELVNELRANADALALS